MTPPSFPSAAPARRSWLPYNEGGMNFSASSRYLAYGRSLFVLLLLLSLTVCSNAPAAKRYELEGRVVAVDPAARQLTIAHQDVPGLMKAMTMPFTVGKANRSEERRVGKEC